MLAAMEDLLDTWPGPLVVVSHDRYLLERVTDVQYAVLDHHVRHLPGGIDEYLALRTAQERREATAIGAAAAGSAGAATGDADGAGGGAGSGASGGAPALSGRALRDAQKEASALERRMARLESEIAGAKNALADVDPSDYTALADAMRAISAQQDELAEVEERWLEVGEQLG